MSCRLLCSFCGIIQRRAACRSAKPAKAFFCAARPCHVVPNPNIGCAASMRMPQQSVTSETVLQVLVCNARDCCFCHESILFDYQSMPHNR